MKGAKAGKRLKLRLLGGFSVEVGGKPVGERRWTRRKAKTLVKLLALQANQRLHRERAIDLLWAEREFDSAVNSLHKTMHAARRALEPDLRSGAESSFIVVREDEIVLRAPDGLWIDADEFETRANAALLAVAAATTSENISECETALNLYTGELLPGDIYEDWTSARRERLHELYRRVGRKLVGLYRSAATPERAIALCERLLADDATDEAVWRDLMRLTAQTGDRQAALRFFEQCLKALQSELGDEPEPETFALRDQIAAGKIELQSKTNSGKSSNAGEREKILSNLPHPVASFVGRKAEIASLKEILGKHRLVTLTGAGGIGKTRLALEIGAVMLENFTDGVWLIELAALTDSVPVKKSAAKVLGVREDAAQDLLETLAAHLRTKRVLLILDNCEHLIEECAQIIIRLLSSCVGLQVLATSREALNLAGEVVWRVAPLSLPDGEMVENIEMLLEREAVRLFVDRARLSNPMWTLNLQNAEATAGICRRLDGIPLALELAAARIKTLSSEQILARLDDRFQFLAGNRRAFAARHQTLRATIDWSYESLSAQERMLFRRLAVFAGGATLEAVEQVCAAEDLQTAAILDLLTDLIDKSLVSVETADASDARYNLLETIREYGFGLLQGDEATLARRRHAAFFLALAEAAEGEFYGAGEALWFERLEGEHDNLRAALQWSFESGAAETATRLAGALWRFWFVRGHYREGQAWLEKAMRASSDDDILPEAAKCFHGAAMMAYHQGNYARARELYEKGLAHSRCHNLARTVFSTLNGLGTVAYAQGERTAARSFYEETLAVAKNLKDERFVAVALNNLGVLSESEDDYEQARTLYEKSLAIQRRHENKNSIANLLGNLGQVAVKQKDYELARRHYEECLSLCQDSGNKLNAAFALVGLADLAVGGKRAERAAQMLGAADALRESIGFRMTADEHADYDRILTAAQTNLKPQVFQTAYAQGKKMTLNQAIRYALQIS